MPDTASQKGFSPARRAKWLGGALALASSLASAQGITVQPGASLSLGNGQVTLGCGDLTVSGQVSIGAGSATGIRDVDISGGNLAGGSGTVSLSGNWANSGTFAAGSGVVRIVDGCATNTSSLAGDNDFNDFSVTSSSGKLLTVAANSSHFFASSLTLQGVIGNLLQIRSSMPGVQVFFSLDAGGSQTIFAVDVADNNATGGQGLAPGDPGDSQSVDSGNNDNWFIDLLDLIFRGGFES